MKNGIIINGIAYKVVQHTTMDQMACEHCDLQKKCEEVGSAPCLLFAKAGYWCNFKKVK